jgi:signal transduction histidine kinase
VGFIHVAVDFIQEWTRNNLDIVFFVYGLAFVTMGICILVQPRKGSEFAVSNILWLLAVFGISHGLNEHLDMWALIKGRSLQLDIVRWFILLISYVFLFEFGRHLLQILFPESPSWQKFIVKVAGWWMTPVIIFFTLVVGFMSQDFWTTGSIWTRYLLGFPGGIFIGAGFYLYYRNEERLLRPLRIRKYFLIGGWAFLIYGNLGGLIVPKGNFPPSIWLNTESFASFMHIPVQVFRAACAIFAAWAVSGMLKIFNWESKIKLQHYHEQLRALVTKLSVVEEQERKRISEVLHDNIIQNLAISKMRLSSIHADTDISGEIKGVRDLIDGAIKYTRTLTFELSPPVLSELGLKPAIEWLTEQFRKNHGLSIGLEMDDIPKNLKSETSILLFKAIRELLFNVVKHSRVKNAEVSVKIAEGDILISVRDKGIGFDASRLESCLFEIGCYGILNIRERINYLGGSFYLDSKEGRGTRITISIPMSKETA